MAAITSQSIAGPTSSTLPTAITVASSDTIAAAQFGPNGCVLRVINGSGGSINVTVSDPGSTALGNTSAGTAVAVANGVARMFYIPRSAINPATGVATVAYSGISSVTAELYRI